MASLEILTFPAKKGSRDSPLMSLDCSHDLPEGGADLPRPMKGESWLLWVYACFTLG